jgi:hypothetical protein
MSTCRVEGGEPIPACSRCGRQGGHIPLGNRRPARFAGSRWGHGKLCVTCYKTLWQRSRDGGELIPRRREDSGPVPPCSYCGDPGGPVREGCHRPVRADGSRWSMGKVCSRCASRFREREKRGLPALDPCARCGLAIDPSPPPDGGPARHPIRLQYSRYGVLCPACHAREAGSPPAAPLPAPPPVVRKVKGPPPTTEEIRERAAAIRRENLAAMREAGRSHRRDSSRVHDRTR